MDLKDVTLMACPAGTPVLVEPRGLNPWHPDSKTWCTHGDPMPFPSQPAVSPYGRLVKRIRALLAEVESAGDDAVGRRELAALLDAAPEPVPVFTYSRGALLRAQVEALVQLWEQRRKTHVFDAHAVVTDLRRVLSGEYDPRTDPDL